MPAKPDLTFLLLAGKVSVHTKDYSVRLLIESTVVLSEQMVCEPAPFFVLSLKYYD